MQQFAEQALPTSAAQMWGDGLMDRPTGLRCIRCGAEYAVAEKLFKGYPKCLAEEPPANLVVQYDFVAIKGAFDPRRLGGRPLSTWRYQELLQVALEDAVSIGEGMTPLVAVPRLARQLGPRELYVKKETVNPMWSFKDRLASSADSAARAMGYR